MTSKGYIHIKLLTPENSVAEQFTERQNFEENYFSLMAEAKDLLSKQTAMPNEAIMDEDAGSTRTESSVKRAIQYKATNYSATEI